MKAKIPVLNFSAQPQKEETVEVNSVSADAGVFRQYLGVLESRARKGNAAVKTRGDVRGGGRKPWRQKGTGRARQGSIRSPIWRGGGVVHGPSERNYQKSFNHQMIGLVWRYVFWNKLKAAAGLLILAKDQTPLKTRNAQSFLAKAAPKARRVLFVSSDAELRRVFANLKNSEVQALASLNPLEINRADLLVVDERDWPKLSLRLG